MSKYLCGRCHQGFDDLQVFGNHICLGDNPILAALSNINLGEYSIDLRKVVEEAVEKVRIQKAVDSLEDGLRRGDFPA